MSIENRAKTDPAAFQPPPGFDEYRLIQSLGAGRMGMVYLAHDELLERHVAVKFIPTIDDDALAWFMVEARAAARIQHPNVATLYRVGQLDDRPYLIYEFVRGTSLDKLARPVDPAEVLRIAIDLTRGLAAAHRRGVLHRDIKPGNAILAETGEAKLLDFGVAKLVESAKAEARATRLSRDMLADGTPRPTAPNSADDANRLTDEDEDALADLSAGQLLGTPYFMSPEAWRRKSTERADLFSLGLVLYELLAGKGPFRDVPLPELPRAVLDRDARPLRAAAPTVPEAIAAVVDRCVRRNPDDRFASADHLLAALEALSPARAGAKVPEGNPYRGLRPFEPEHRAVFFGRQRALSQALDRLRVERFLLVTGDSGVGKSSMCAAGILPIASEGGLEDGRTWSIARMVPGRQPALALAAALGPVLGGGEDELERAIRADPASLGRVIRKRQREHDGVLIYVDQLEELVTLADAAEAAATSEAIAQLAGGLPGVRVLATARSDFLSRLEGLAGFSGRVSRALFLLGPLGPDEIREAVVGPAAVKHVRFADEATVDHLVESTIAAQGAMPLLQFALAELWERRDLEAGVIPAAALDELGGVSGALSRHADALIGALLPAERAAARAVMLRLVTVDRTRARRPEDELVLSPQHRAALDALVRGRLVVAGDSVDGATYEIAHEALVEGWGTLAAWLAEAAETRALHHRVETAAAEWRKKDKRRDLLWGARLLVETSAIPADDLTAREREFLEASRRGNTRTVWLRRAALIGVVLIGAAVWVASQIKARDERNRQIAASVERAEVILSEARDLDLAYQQARANALRAFDTRAAEAAVWPAVLDQRQRVLAKYRAGSLQLERALLLDGSRADVRRRLSEVLFDRAVVADRETQPAARDDLLDRLRIYDDGEFMRRWDAPGQLSVSTEPPGAEVRLRRYTSTDRRRALDAGVSLGRTPLASFEVAPGSIMVELRAPGHAPVDYPAVVTRGETLTVTVPLPAAAAVPPGFAWIPTGRALYGSTDDETVRTFFNAVPAHVVSTDAFLIARTETTFAEWIAYLEDLPENERASRTPHVGESSGDPGWTGLRRLAPGRWELTLNTGVTPLVAELDRTITYPERTIRAEQDWRRIPVVGVAYDDAVAYAAWLDKTRRVPGARLCREAEWERAARGADDRIFPHGDVLLPDDANFDETYDKKQRSFGPDEVGSHPRSRSPFGVDDLVGNVWEWVAPDVPTGEPCARGGSFYYAHTTTRVANRELPDRIYRDVGLGVRICATPP